MLTGLKIHTDNNVSQVPEVPESYNTRDFRADVLLAHGDGHTLQKWALKDGTTGAVLDLHLTLEENKVGNNHELYLVSAVPVQKHILELEVVAPTGKTLKCEAPSSTIADSFLAQLAQHFRLPKLDEHGRPNRWNLVQRKTNTTLDPKRMPADNGIAAGDPLSIEATPYKNIAVTISSPSGGSYQPEILEAILTGELLRRSAITPFSLPPMSGAGKPIEWLIVRKDSGMRLELTKSLGENGLNTGDQLLIERVSKPPLARSLPLASGKVFPFEPLAEALAGDFLNSLVGSLRLDRFSKRGRPNIWLLVDRRTKRPLDPTKNLLENGIKSGDQLWLILEIAELGVEVVAPNGAIIPRAEPGDTLDSNPAGGAGVDHDFIVDEFYRFSKEAGARGSMQIPVPSGASHISGFRVPGSTSGEVTVRLFRTEWNVAEGTGEKTRLVEEIITNGSFHKEVELNSTLDESHALAVSIHAEGPAEIWLVAVKFH
jgi:hypothetical protein